MKKLDTLLNSSFLTTLKNNKNNLDNREYDLLDLIESTPGYINHIPGRVKRVIISKYKENYHEVTHTTTNERCYI